MLNFSDILVSPLFQATAVLVASILLLIAGGIAALRLARQLVLAVQLLRNDAELETDRGARFIRLLRWKVLSNTQPIILARATQLAILVIAICLLIRATAKTLLFGWPSLDFPLGLAAMISSFSLTYLLRDFSIDGTIQATKRAAMSTRLIAQSVLHHPKAKYGLAISAASLLAYVTLTVATLVFIRTALQALFAKVDWIELGTAALAVAIVAVTMDFCGLAWQPHRGVRFLKRQSTQLQLRFREITSSGEWLSRYLGGPSNSLTLFMLAILGIIAASFLLQSLYLSMVGGSADWRLLAGIIITLFVFALSKPNVAARRRVVALWLAKQRSVARRRRDVKSPNLTPPPAAGPVATLLELEGHIEDSIENLWTQHRRAIAAALIFAFAAAAPPFLTWFYFAQLIITGEKAAQDLTHFGFFVLLGSSTGLAFLAIALFLFRHAKIMAQDIAHNERRLYYIRKLRAAFTAFPEVPDLQKGLVESLLRTGDGFEVEGKGDKKGEEEGGGSLPLAGGVQTLLQLMKGATKP